LANALDIAANVVAVLGPHCLKIDIAGSVRRQSPTIGDLEIVCLPDRSPLESTPLFAGGFAAAVEQWPGIKELGQPNGRTSFLLMPGDALGSILRGAYCGARMDQWFPAAPSGSCSK